MTQYKMDADVLVKNVPQCMRTRKQWVVWRYEEGSNGKQTKVPYQPYSSYKASSTREWSWSDFGPCVEYACEKASGVGYCLSEHDGLVGYDIDHISGEDIKKGQKTIRLSAESKKPYIDKILELFANKAYIEYSPSGDGLRIICRSNDLPRPGKGQSDGEFNFKWIEAYNFKSPRYLTITGNIHPLSSQSLDVSCKTEVQAMHDLFFKSAQVSRKKARSGNPRYTSESANAQNAQKNARTHEMTDDEILQIAFKSKKGHELLSLMNGQFEALYDSHSDADLGLCLRLAFWFQKDAYKIDRIFRKSGLYRPEKWKKVTSASRGWVYGEKTIERAIDECSEIFNPAQKSAHFARFAHVVDSSGNELARNLREICAPPPDDPLFRKDASSENFLAFPEIYSASLGGRKDFLDISPQKPQEQPFPLDLLYKNNNILYNTIYRLNKISLAPCSLCGQAVLAIASFCTQHLADLQHPITRSRVPLSLFFVTIASPNERKSSVDKLASKGIARYEDELEKAFKANLDHFYREMASFKQEQKKGNTEVEPPRELQRPDCFVSDVTAEGLFRSLQLGEFSQAFFNDEGGVFLGGHAMSKDNLMKTAAMLNMLWDASKLKRSRTAGSEKIRDRRLAFHLQVQPGPSEKLLSDGLLKQLGFTARCLISEPKSSIGTRGLRDKDHALTEEQKQELLDGLAEFHNLTFNLLCKPRRTISPEGYLELLPDSLDDDGVKTELMQLTPEAREMWIDFHDRVELELIPSHRHLLGWLGKAPEQALRLSSVLSMFGQAASNQLTLQVEKKDMESAIALVMYYFEERQRADVDRGSEEDERAEQLRVWLYTKCKETKTSIRIISKYGPSSVRGKRRTVEAIEILVRCGYLSPLDGEHEIRGKKRKQCFEIVGKEVSCA